MDQGLRRIDPLDFEDNTADNWRKFEKENCYADLSDKSKKVQAYTLLNLAGAEAVDKAETFVYEDEEDHKDPEVLLAKFSEVSLSAKNVIMDRHAFNTAVQKPGESVQAYVSTLKILARKCEFGSLQDELIRDRIVCGIENDTVRKHLLCERNLTLDQTVNICLRSERIMKQLRKVTDVFALQKTSCSICNGQHLSEKSMCNACNNYHFTRCYRSALAHSAFHQPRVQQKDRIHEHDAQPEDNVQDSFFRDPFELTYQKGEIFTSLNLKNGRDQLKVKVDTGARCNVISKRMLNSATINHTIHINTTEKDNLVAYGGETINTVGTAVLHCIRGRFKFHVVDQDVKPLLGLQDSIAIGLIQLGPDVHMLHPEAPEMGIKRGDERRRGSSVASLVTDSDPVPTIPQSDTEYYNLTQRPLGHCLIINNYNFEKMTSLLNREGTEKDKDYLSRLFKKMHFKVEVLDDLMASEIKDAINNFAKKDHTQMGAFVCCVLSHGEKGAVLGIDGKRVEIHELTLPFTECRTLASKPKLFFIQACQGKKGQNSVWAADGQGNNTEEGTLEEDSYNPPLRRVPIKADFLIGMATVEHYQSFRHNTEGSIYIQELCRQLELFSPRNEDILSILTKVNFAVSTKVLKGYKQMPEPRYTLTKKLVLPMD